MANWNAAGPYESRARQFHQLRGRLKGRCALGLASLLLSFAAPLTSLHVITAEAAPATAAAYVAIQPCRLADTRLTGGYARLDPLTLQISTRGVCGLPNGATSLALTLTVVKPEATGFLTAWPADQARPTVSNLNFNGSEVRANGSITSVDSSGSFRVFTSVPAQVVVDVVGAFVASGAVATGRFVSRPATRWYDSRPAAKLSPSSSLTLALPSGVPADAVALVLNITVTESSGPGFVTEFPAGRQMPTSSILNVDQADQTRAAAGIFPISAAGVALFSSGGGHIIVDLLGYFTGPSAGAGTQGLFTAYDPTRLLDTRGTSPLGTAVPLYPGGGLELPVSQGGSMVYNITAVAGDAGYVSAFPAGANRPSTSSVNSVGASDVVANFAVTQVSNRGLGVFSQSRTHLLIDLQGWFSGPSATATLAPPTNTQPPTPQPTFSACTHDGLATINAKRTSVGVAPLVINAGAEGWACSWALQLAQAGSGLSHSDPNGRSAAAGCPAGENIALSGAVSTAHIYSMWFASPTHLANLTNSIYKSVGIGFVVRTDVTGLATIYGVNDFATC